MERCVGFCKQWKHLGINEANILSNFFKMHIDRTPIEIINSRRLLEAKRLLKYSTIPIQEIADELSFGDVQAFSNFIKKQTGQTPSMIRMK